MLWMISVSMLRFSFVSTSHRHVWFMSGNHALCSYQGRIDWFPPLVWERPPSAPCSTSSLCMLWNYLKSLPALSPRISGTFCRTVFFFARKTMVSCWFSLNQSIAVISEAVHHLLWPKCSHTLDVPALRVLSSYPSCVTWGWTLGIEQSGWISK